MPAEVGVISKPQACRTENARFVALVSHFQQCVGVKNRLSGVPGNNGVLYPGLTLKSTLTKAQRLNYRIGNTNLVLL